MREQERKARFAAQWAAHHTRVLRYVERRVDDLAVADDITQKVFAVLWQKDVGVEPLPSGWLFVTAANHLRHHYRDTQRNRAADETTQILLVAARREVAMTDILILREAVEMLGPHARDLVALHYWDGLTQSEIADYLGMTPGAVATGLSRARARLRLHLTSEDEQQGGRIHA